MEDRAHVIHAFAPNTDLKFSLYCVFDGHGGEQAVNLAHRHLADFVLASKEWKEGLNVCLCVCFFFDRFVF